MKKTILFILLAVGVASVNAQDITSKKGEKFLPEEGDWAIGVDPTPLLQYVGNFFGKTTTNQAPTWRFPNNGMLIQGKYMVDAKTAYRVGLRIGLNSSSSTNVVGDRSDTTTKVFPAIPKTLNNKWTSTSTFVGLTAGIEKRMGSTRLQGFYGAEAGISYSSSGEKFSYGNKLTTTGYPVNVSGADAMGDSGVFNLTTDTYGNAARVTKIKNGGTFYIGVRGFVGAEYFILPKLSLGGEFGWGIGVAMSGKSSYTTESINPANGTVAAVIGTQTIQTGKGPGSLSLDTDNKNSVFGPAASLRITFFFQ